MTESYFDWFSKSFVRWTLARWSIIMSISEVYYLSYNVDVVYCKILTISYFVVMIIGLSTYEIDLLLFSWIYYAISRIFLSFSYKFSDFITSSVDLISPRISKTCFALYSVRFILCIIFKRMSSIYSYVSLMAILSEAIISKISNASCYE